MYIRQISLGIAAARSILFSVVRTCEIRQHGSASPRPWPPHRRSQQSPGRLEAALARAAHRSTNMENLMLNETTDDTNHGLLEGGGHSAAPRDQPRDLRDRRALATGTSPTTSTRSDTWSSVPRIYMGACNACMHGMLSELILFCRVSCVCRVSGVRLEARERRGSRRLF